MPENVFLFHHQYFYSMLSNCFFVFIIENNGVNGIASDNRAGKGSRQVKGAALFLKHFYALLVKRFHHATRSRKDFLAQVLLDVI